MALTLPDQFDYMGNCHCSECRKFSGADYASVGGLDGDKVAIVKGARPSAATRNPDETSLAFCRHCGSSLFSQKRSTGKVGLRLGVLDEAPSQTPAFHIFKIGSRPPGTR